MCYVTLLGPVEVAVSRRGHLPRAVEAAAGEASVEDVEVVDAEVRKISIKSFELTSTIFLNSSTFA